MTNTSFDKNLNTFNTVEYFKILPGTIDYGRDYECLMCSYLSLKLLTNNNIRNFKLSANCVGFGRFDDIVLEIENVLGISYTFAFQIKIAGAGRLKIDVKDLRGKGPLNVFNYLKDHKDLSNADFCILYTNKIIDPVLTTLDDNKIRDLQYAEYQFKKLTNQTTELITQVLTNIDYIFQIGIVNNFNLKANDQISDLEKIFFCTNQDHLPDLERKTVQMFKEIFCCYNNYFEAHKKFVDFFKFWQSHSLHNYKITKNDIHLIVASIFLLPISIPLTDNLVCNDKSRILAKEILKFPVTLCHDYSVADMWPDCYSFKSNISQKISDMVNYFFGSDNETKQLIMFNWLENRAPLIVKVDSKFENQIKAVINLIIEFNSKLSIVLIGDWGTPSKYYENFKTFQNLGDLPNSNDIIQNFQCLFEGRGPFYLKDLPDKMLKLFTVDHLISISKGEHFGFGPQLPSPYFNRSVSTVIFDLNIIDQVNDLIIIGNCEDSKIFLETTITKYPIDLAFFQQNNFNLFKNFLVTKQKLHDDDNDFKALIQNYHYFEIHSNRILEWISSHHCKIDFFHLRKSNLAEYCISDCEILAHFRNEINLIVADPGMGKTVLIDYLFLNCPLNYWPLKINVRDYYTVLKENTSDHLLDLIIEEKQRHHDSFLKSLMQTFIEEKKLLLLWDGLDELQPQLLNIIALKIKCLSDSGYRQFVLTRNHLKTELEQLLNTFALHLIDLDLNTIETYLNNNQIKLKPSTNLDSLLKNPLHLIQFTQIYSQNSNYDLIDMYQQLIDSKFSRYAHHDPLSTFKYFVDLEDYQEAALLQCFGREFSQEKFGIMNCDKFLKKLEMKGFDLGIIIDIDRDTGMPTFVHGSFAEYFAAQYIVQNEINVDQQTIEAISNCELFKEFYKELMRRKKQLV